MQAFRLAGKETFQKVASAILISRCWDMSFIIEETYWEVWIGLKNAILLFIYFLLFYIILLFS